jgi:hypothetical protein
MMFGAGLRGLFRQPPPYNTPGINPKANPPMFDRMPGAMPQQMDNAAAFQMPKLGTLDKLGLVGDLLTGSQFTQQRLAPAQQAAMQEFQYQRQRGDKLEDWEREKAWQTTNRQPHYFEANDGSQYLIGPDGKPQLVFKDPTPKVTMVAVDNGDGTKTVMPFANGAPLGQAPQTQRPPVGAIISDPRKAGGASPSGSQTFRY